MRWTASGFLFASALGIAQFARAEAPPKAQAPADYLARWAAASTKADEPDLDQYLDRYGDRYPATVLKYAAAFFGPVEREGLQSAFRWSVMEINGHEVRLRATPRTHDDLAATPPANAPSSASLTSAASAVAGDRPAEMLAFDVVFDTQFATPRLVSWLGPIGDQPREAVERLHANDDLAETETFRAGWMRNSARSDVEHASAGGILQAEYAAVDPAVREILSRWEQASTEIKSVEIKFKRFDRDNVFEVETRGVGTFIFVAPDRGLYDLKGASVIERASGPAAPSGGRMAVASAKPQLYWWTGDHVTIVDEREKTYDTLPLPKRINGNIQTVGSWDVIWQVLAGPQKALPAVVDLKAENMLSRFEWSVVENSETQVHIEGVPRTTQDRRHIKRLSVMLDSKSYRTTATRLVDPSGARETIHTFEYVRVNDPALSNVDSWKPDLKAMSAEGPPPLAPAVEDLPGAPPPQ